MHPPGAAFPMIWVIPLVKITLKWSVFTKMMMILENKNPGHFSGKTE
jgi:hypothetical protein